MVPRNVVDDGKSSVEDRQLRPFFSSFITYIFYLSLLKYGEFSLSLSFDEALMFPMKNYADVVGLCLHYQQTSS